MNKASRERGTPSISISNNFFQRCVILMMISFLSIASINIILPLFITFEYTTKKSPQNAKPPRWTHRKISSFETKVVQADQQVLLRTGKNTMARSSQHMNQALDEQKKSVNHQDLKRYRLLYETKHSSLTDWPQLSTLIGSNGNIRDDVDVSGILDFAIIGFGKTGTTSILRNLSDLTDSLQKEHCDLVVNDAGKLLKDMYEDRERRLKQAKKRGEELEDRLRGFKCPQDLSSDYSMTNYAKYFPSTKLIVGIRHPVLWFESLYNFRVSNVPWKTMLPTSQLTKGCISGSQGVCAWRASFHDFLSRLGKTPMSSTSEKELLQLGIAPLKTKVGPVFLYEVSQLSENGDDGGVRSAQFRTDLKKFLGLQKDIHPFQHVDTSGRFDYLAHVKRQVDQNKIDICKTEHDVIREVLMKKARASSKWLREYFIQSDEVFVSAREHFVSILESWMYDPCLN